MLEYPPALVSSSSVASRNGVSDTGDLTPDQHRANEEAFVTYRQSLIDGLANQSIIAPSRLSHDDVDSQVGEAAPDPPPEPDPETYVRRAPRGRGGTSLGRAVHSVLQVIDLATLSDLDVLATAAALDEAIPEQFETICRYVRNAAGSAPIQEALASGRYWREVPIGAMWNGSDILEGAIDLLYAAEDGALHIADYKTDHITEAQLGSRANEYRSQGEAYATTIERITGDDVVAIHFIFAALARTSSLTRTAADPSNTN
jgi:ATP-dependent exoDNAse (exonuclease V) beta subunit